MAPATGQPGSAAVSTSTPAQWPVAVSDAPGRDPARDQTEPTATARWLVSNAWQYGFIPALPESDLGRRLGYEPWRLRWVGRQMAAQLKDAPASGNYAAIVTAALRQAQTDLASP